MTSQVYTPVSGRDDDLLMDDASMITGLIDRPAIGTLAPTVGQSIMQVTAPATLPEGYEIPVMLGSLQFKVKVPLGGVEKGQVFNVPIPTDTLQRTTSACSIPVGAWRDDVCDCFNYGVCHPHLWTSCLCPLLAAGQVINRLKFSWNGTPSHTTAESARGFAILLYITIFHWILFGILELSIIILYPTLPVPSDPIDYDHYVPTLPPIPQPEGLLLSIIWVYDIFKYLYVIITIVLLIRLRRSVRAKFVIPGTFVNDCCCSYWCPCLVAGQMLRHTTDYDLYPSQLCSSTGLSSRVGPMTV